MFVFLPGKDQRNPEEFEDNSSSKGKLPPLWTRYLWKYCTRMLTICYYLVPIISTIYCYYYVHSSVSIVVRLTTHSPGEGHASEFGEKES